MDLVLNNLDDVALMIFAKNLWIWKEAMSKSYHFFAYDHKQDWLPWAKIALWVKFEMNRRKWVFDRDARRSGPTIYFVRLVTLVQNLL